MPAIGRKPGPRAWPEPTGTVPRASTFRPPLHMHVFCMLYLAPDLSRRIRCEPHRAKVSRASTFQTREETMNRALTTLAFGASLFASLAVSAQAAPEVSLARFECGTPQEPQAVNPRFSDTYSYGDLKLQFVYSCYLIKHGDEYMLWDTGHAMT